MKPKLFTIDEANALVPRIAALVQEIAQTHERIRLASQDINGLFDIWGETIYEKSCADNAAYNDKLKERTELLAILQNRIEQIRDLGGVVKDLTAGLIDFYHEADGDLVFLCWKSGEPSIQHWHRLHEGYTSRKPLSIRAQPI